MKSFVSALVAVAALSAVSAHASPFIDPTLQFRVGFDNNPIATGGSAESVLGGRDSIVTAAGFGFGLASPTAPGRASGKLTYAGEIVRFDGWSGENYATHRFGATGQATAADWRLSADLSSLFVDGSRDTLLSLAACNGNGTSLWRERRAQWQHRAKLLAQRDAGALRVRILATALDYDYLTRYVAGRAAFCDRSDLLGGLDAGWVQSKTSWWFLGARAGVQHQAQAPLPGAAIDYSNRYARLVAGWEGKLSPDTTVTLAAGPDFRHYDGTVDPKTFRDRDHTFLWFDASLATKLSPTLSLTAKSTRSAWLSSTGKSAYTDFSTEVALAWTVSPALTLRGGVKGHQCSYFPTVRNDWELFSTLGATYKVSPRLQLTADVLDHRGWNVLSGINDRAFNREVVTLGVTWKI